jgi:hypothetical protein
MSKRISKACVKSADIGRSGKRHTDGAGWQTVALSARWPRKGPEADSRAVWTTAMARKGLWPADMWWGKWWGVSGLNRRPTDYESAALTD